MFGIKRWAAAVLFLAAMTAAGGAERMLWHPYANGLGAGGYDVVAYFAGGKAAKGREEFSADHGGQTWRFASDEHRQQFLAAPQNYLPQYGGYCAYAASLRRAGVWRPRRMDGAWRQTVFQLQRAHPRPMGSRGATTHRLRRPQLAVAGGQATRQHRKRQLKIKRDCFSFPKQTGEKR